MICAHIKKIKISNILIISYKNAQRMVYVIV